MRLPQTSFSHLSFFPPPCLLCDVQEIQASLAEQRAEVDAKLSEAQEAATGRDSEADHRIRELQDSVNASLADQRAAVDASLSEQKAAVDANLAELAGALEAGLAEQKSEARAMAEGTEAKLAEADAKQRQALESVRLVRKMSSSRVCADDALPVAGPHAAACSARFHLMPCPRAGFG